MKYIANRNKVLLPLEHQRGAPGRCETDRAERLCDGLLAIDAPSKDSSTELAQGDGTLARGDQGSRSDADLDAGCKNEFLARLAVLSQLGCAVETANAPL